MRDTVAMQMPHLYAKLITIIYVNLILRGSCFDVSLAHLFMHTGFMYPEPKIYAHS